SQRDTTEFETLQKDQESLNDMMHLEQEMQARRDHCASITVDKAKLLEQISEEEETACMARAQFDIYRRKMVSHRQAVLRKMDHTDACKEEKTTLVEKLRKFKEELKEDLENPHGIKVQEIEALTVEIGELMENIAERRESLQKELESHVQLKQDIEGQTKRFNAIIKHLHCQISKAQPQPQWECTIFLVQKATSAKCLNIVF
uniref:Coiled-coil domain containing 122 n=1 Tax=Hippocampus comes TaxID=109280 RepID=A0A3Q2YTH3_HIPCM